jgi:hypothetical protein
MIWEVVLHAVVNLREVVRGPKPSQSLRCTLRVTPSLDLHFFLINIKAIVKAQRVLRFPEGRYQGDIKGGGEGSSGSLEAVGYGTRVLRRLQSLV